jgi:hypothetical protein
MINSDSRRNNDFVLLNIERARIDSPKKCLISAKTRSNRSKNIVDLGSGRVGSGHQKIFDIGSVHKKLTHVGL